MSSNSKDNNEVPMEDLFRDSFQDHKESIDERDLDGFMNQLEATGYFDKPNRRFPILLSLSLLLLSGTLLLLYILVPLNTSLSSLPSNNKNKTMEDKANENPTIDNSDTLTVKEGSIEKESIIRSKTLSVESKSTVIQNANKSSVKEQVTTDMEEYNISMNNFDTIREKDKTIIIVPDSVIVTKGKVINKINQVDSLRVQYVMQVDTVKVVDSTNINMRKYQKMKRKNK